MRRKIFFLLPIFIITICTTGCFQKNKKSDEKTQTDYTLPSEYSNAVGDKKSELRSAVVDEIVRAIGDDRETKLYRIVAEFYQDFNNDGRKDYVCVFEFEINRRIQHNYWVGDCNYGVGYALSGKSEKNIHITYNLMPSLNSVSKPYGDNEKYAYSLVSSDTPNEDSFSLRFTDYYTNYGDDSVTNHYRDKNLEKFWVEMTFEYNDNVKTFALVKCGGLNVYEERGKSVIFRNLHQNPVYLSVWRDWFYFLKFCSVENPIDRNKVKHVKNEAEFLAAIDNNTTIRIQADTLNLTRERIHSKIPPKNKHIKTVNEYKDSTVVIFSGLENLEIIGDREDYPVVLVVDEVMDEVLRFEDSRNITLDNLLMTHSVPAGTCESGVLVCKNTRNVLIRGCSFDGSGIIGLELDSVFNADIYESYFFHNDHHAIEVNTSENIGFFNCAVYNNNTIFSTVSVYASSVRFGNCDFFENNIKRDDLSVIELGIQDNEQSHRKKKVPRGFMEFFDVRTYDITGGNGNLLTLYTYSNRLLSGNFYYEEMEKKHFYTKNEGHIGYAIFTVDTGNESR